MTEALKKYGIHFYLKKSINPVTGIKETLRIFDVSLMNYYILVTFFDDYQNASDIQLYILDIIEDVIYNNINEGETGSQAGVAVYINSNITKFVDFNSTGSYLSPDLTIPTTDFKEIAIAWKNFVQ